jgi:PAS domain S-box-containing protein
MKNTPDGENLKDDKLRRLAEAEERMRSVVNHVLDGIVTIDARGTITTFNPAAERIFGYVAAEVIGQNVKVLMPEPDRSRHDGHMANYLRTGEAKIIGRGREVTGQRKDGSTFPMDLAVTEFRIESRPFFTGIVRDITERKRLEQQLKQRVEELAEADRQKNEFLAMLAHELRNPLAPLRNALHLIKHGAPPELIEQARSMMDRQLEYLVRLVDDLLDVSRIISNKIELRKERLEFSAAVKRAVETAQPVIDAHGHELLVSMPRDPLVIEGDLIRLSQVIANLLTNAAKYSDKPGRIWLTAEERDGYAQVRVKDEGIGIESEFLPRIFDLFVQADHSLARSGGGMGMGLTLVRRLAEMHGGSVSAFSEGRGKGSEFLLQLPAKHMLEAHDEPALPAAAPEAKGRQRVLVVDDNVDAAESMALILNMSGYETLCAYDGPSALEAAGDYKPDVVVLDIGLPGMTGYEVAEKLRRQAEFDGTPIIAVTGYGQEDDRLRSRQAGFDHHLVKPVNPETLQSFLAQGRSGAQAVRY